MNRKLLLAIAVAVGTTSTAVAQIANYQPNPNGVMPSMPGGVIADGYSQPVIMSNASAPNYNPAAFQAPVQSAPAAGTGTSGAGCQTGECVGQNYFADGCGQGCNDCCDGYLSLIGGWNSVENVTFNNPAGAPTQSSFKEGWIGGFAIGRQKTCYRRHELEFAVRDNSAESVTTPNGNVPFFGDIQATSLLYSVLMEPSHCVFGLKPFAGAGFGVAYMDGDFNDGGRGICYLQDTVFAWQLRAGVTREINSRVSAFAEYRYFSAEDLDVHCQVAGGPIMSSPVDYRAESVVFGINIRR